MAARGASRRPREHPPDSSLSTVHDRPEWAAASLCADDSADRRWCSRSVAAMAEAVAAALEAGSVAEASEPGRIPSLIRQVAELARPSDRRRDPARGSWPTLLRRRYDLAYWTLHALEAAGGGHSHAPLCRFWELYESWVVSRLAEHLEAVCGQPRIAPTQVGWADAGGASPRPTWWTYWMSGDRRLDVWVQLRVGRGGPKVFKADWSVNHEAYRGLPGLVSVTSDLIPDGLCGPPRRERGRGMGGGCEASRGSNDAGGRRWGERKQIHVGASKQR